MEKARNHSKECALVGHCVESGYGFVTEDGRLTLLDPHVTQKAVDVIEQSENEEGIPLGVPLIETPTVGPTALLLGIAATNLTEAVAGAAGMTEGDRSATWTPGVWTVTAVGLGATVIIGRFGFANVGATELALIRATGGGAVLVSLAVEMMPDAYEGGGSTVAVATATGSPSTTYWCSPFYRSLDA